MVPLFTTLPSQLSKMPSKKLCRRPRSSVTPSFTESLSSSSMSVNDSCCPSRPELARKSSFLTRLWHGRTRNGSTSVPTKNGEVALSTSEKDKDQADDQSHSSSHDALVTAELFERVVVLEQRGMEQKSSGQSDAALATWKEGLCLIRDISSSSEDWNALFNRLICRLISLQLQIHEKYLTEHSQCLEEAVAFLSQLQPVSDTSTYLQPSSLLVELLMQHSFWTLALEISNQLPSIGPLKLARLHLEIALQNEGTLDRQSVGDSTMRHLSECHQLLLSCAKDVEKNAYLDLWQELAQAYSMRGEEELALGCIQSRLQYLTAPKEVALAHYEQALHVYVPIGQYGMALTETEQAIAFLQNKNLMGDSPLSDGEHKEETDEEEILLLLKLYQFKADLLCRLGRLNESIDNYEILLQAYVKSANHGPADAANICYILGKLSVRAKRYEQAFAYFDQELQLTRTVVGYNHLAVSKILHEMARIADSKLMDYERSLCYYEEALQIESEVFSYYSKAQQSNGNKSLLQDVRHQISETKKCIGKLHFKMGDFDTAVKTMLAVEKDK